jgi:hypothetical protein
MLDLDMVSAACPTCKILFVEDLGIDSTDVENAWNAAIAFGATYISNSFGIPETSFIGPDGGSAPSASEAWVREQEAFFAAHPTVSFFAGTGDWGYDRHADGSVGMYWPATSAYVTAVGGTTIAETATSPWFSQSAWGSGGAGCSQAIAVPSWQSSSLCNGYRSVADVSAVAQGVSMYDSYGSGGWIGVNGTSVSTPVTAGIYASNGWTGKSPSFSYTSTSLFADVTSGNDCTAATGETCDAGVGYDQPTGNGFPHGSAPVDTFYGAPSSISVPQNGNGFVNLTWAGPWVAQDDGRDATFSFASALYGQYANVSYYESGYAILQLTPTLDATPNVTYPITVTATDLESGVEHSTVVNLTVTQCQQIVCGANQCGTIATTNGCGGSAVECPGCPSGESCSSNVCCPNGKHWDPTDDVCVLTCAAGTEICPATGTCLTSIACNVQSGGGCRKVGNIVECN